MMLQNVKLQKFIESFDYHPDNAIEKSILAQEPISIDDTHKRKNFVYQRNDDWLKRTLSSKVISKSDLLQIFHYYHERHDFVMSRYMLRTDFKKSPFRAFFTNQKTFKLNLNENLSFLMLKKVQSWFPSFSKIVKFKDKKGDSVHPKSYAELCLLDSIIQMDLDKFTNLIEHIKFDMTRFGSLAFEQVMSLQIDNNVAKLVEGEHRTFLLNFTEQVQIKLLYYYAKPIDFSPYDSKNNYIKNQNQIKHWGRCQQLAVFRNQVKLVRQLLKYGYFPLPKDCQNQEPLNQALKFQNYEMLDALLDMQFEPNASMFYEVYKSRKVDSDIKINILCKMLRSEMSIDECKDIVVDVIRLRSEVLLSALIDCITRKNDKENLFELPNFQEVLNMFDITLFAQLIEVLKYPPVSIDLVKNIENELKSNKDYKTSQIIKNLVKISLANHVAQNNFPSIIYSNRQKNGLNANTKKEKVSGKHRGYGRISYHSDDVSSESSNSSSGSDTNSNNATSYSSDDSLSSTYSSSRAVL